MQELSKYKVILEEGGKREEEGGKREEEEGGGRREEGGGRREEETGRKGEWGKLIASPTSKSTEGEGLLGETGKEFTVPQCSHSYLLKGKGCGPGSLDGMVSPQGGSVHAGVRLCGVGRVTVLERCRLSFRVRSQS